MQALYGWIPIVSLLLVASISSNSVHAADGCQPLPKDFLSVADLRGSLNTEIGALKSEIAELEAMPSSEEGLRADVARLQKEVDDLEKKGTLSEPEQLKLRGDRDQIGSLKNALEKADQRKVTITGKKKSLSEKQELAACVQEKLAKMLSPDQQFKLYTSIAFAVLIGAVIAGFFLVSFSNKNILEAIFSGQAGLQFLTLFSLVIAIILFGILGILESKELSALLGGLSGYILGRGTATRQETQHSVSDKATPTAGPTRDM